MNHHFYMDLLNNPNLLKEIHLVNGIKGDWFQDQLGPQAIVHCSTKIMSHIGTIKKGDFVHVHVQATGSASLVHIDVFLEVLMPFASTSRFFFIAHACERIGDKLWQPPSAKVTSPVYSMVKREIVRIDPNNKQIHTSF